MFDVGQAVALREDPTWIGGVRAVLPAIQGTPRYQVVLADGVTRDCAEHELASAPDPVGGDSTFGWFRVRLIEYLTGMRPPNAVPARHRLMRFKVDQLAPHDVRV